MSLLHASLARKQGTTLIEIHLVISYFTTVFHKHFLKPLYDSLSKLCQNYSKMEEIIKVVQNFSKRAFVSVHTKMQLLTLFFLKLAFSISI